MVCIGFLIRRMTDTIEAGHRAGQQVHDNLVRTQEQAAVLAHQTERLAAAEGSLRALVYELETPLVDLADQIVLVPIIGTLNPARAEAIRTRVVQAAHARRIRLLVVDLAGLPTADTAGIQVLYSMLQALKLLGCRVVLTGFSPVVAIKFQHLGVDLTKIEIKRSPQDVLPEYLRYQERYSDQQ